MPKITFLPHGKTFTARTGESILEAARNARIVIRSRCSGNASCLQCKVYVQEQSGLSPMQNKERQKLAGADIAVRLACQAHIQGDVNIEIPEDPLKKAIREQLARQKLEQ